jgi:aryl-alcohol dehydrogenase-like predicted oxidoreductase
VVAEYVPGFGSDAQRALQFVRSTPGIGTALVGMKSVAHVDENAAVAAVPPMAWEQFQRMFSQA